MTNLNRTRINVLNEVQNGSDDTFCSIFINAMATKEKFYGCFFDANEFSFFFYAEMGRNLLILLHSLADATISTDDEEFAAPAAT